MPFSADRVVIANSRQTPYRFRLAMEPGLILDGELDPAHDRGHLTLRSAALDASAAEAYWSGDRGFGARHGTWFGLRGRPCPDQRAAVASMLRDGRVLEVREEPGDWVVLVDPPRTPLQDEPEEVLRRTFGEPVSDRMRRFRARATDMARQLQVSLQLTVARTDDAITRAVIACRAPGLADQWIMSFAALDGDIPAIPDSAMQATLGSPLPAAALTLAMPTIGGWECRTHHAPWAQQSINLIRDSEHGLPESDRQYSEIYEQALAGAFSAGDFDPSRSGQVDPGEHHPLVLGAWHEDCSGWANDTRGMPDFYDTWFYTDPAFFQDKAYYYPSKPFFRDYHHFGGDGDGLEWRWYFAARGYPPTEVAESSGNAGYYSARDWGYGAGRLHPQDEHLNRLTFTRAVEQYHQYSWDGKRRAYLMLGHVVHLLQDIGMPDHAALVPHPGSGYTEPEAFDTFRYCEILAAEHELAWLPGAFPIIVAACHASAHGDQMGFERLLSEAYMAHWTANPGGFQLTLRAAWDPGQVDASIRAAGIQRRGSYDEYFHDMAQISQQALTLTAERFPEAGIRSPLGCGTLDLVPPVPGANPDIDGTDLTQVEPYLGLAREVIPPIVGLSAGLVETFFDTVNYPPVVEEVRVVQWQPGALPLAFGVLAENAPLHCLRYRSQWQDDAGRRIRIDHVNSRVSADRPAYIFVRFGPASIRPVTGGRRMREAFLALTGHVPGTVEHLHVEVPLTETYDPDGGYYYWGSYLPRNCSPDHYQLTMEIRGRDRGPHARGRNPAGDEVDADPASYARSDITAPMFPWIDYSPGTDISHHLTVDVNPIAAVAEPALIEIPARRNRQGEALLTLLQQAWDCNREHQLPFPSPCPVEWSVDDAVTKLRPGAQPPAPADAYGLHLSLADPDLAHPPAGSGGKLLVVTADERCAPGRYLVTARYEAGMPPHTKDLPVVVEVS